MGTLSALGLDGIAPNNLHTLINRLAGTRIMSTILSRTLRPLDATVLRISRGNSTLSSWIGGHPIVWLTARGRRTGNPRRVPLLAIPFVDDIAVIGSNFGSPGHPAWALNLEANPEAQVEAHGVSIPSRARRADLIEEEKIWERAASTYPGYSSYREWAQGRHIKVFILEKV